LKNTIGGEEGLQPSRWDSPVVKDIMKRLKFLEYRMGGGAGKGKRE
jgi:hypothetical protein